MKLEALDRQIQVFVSDLKSPKARSARLAQVAEDGIAEIQKSNAAATGRPQLAPKVTVDGRAHAALASVKPDGVIVAEFDQVRTVLDWIGKALVQESPVLTGKYQRSHVLLVDGVEHDPTSPAIPSAELYRFVNRQPYSAKIERDGVLAGQSPQSADGVYMVVAAVAGRVFSEVAQISYSTKYFDEATRLMHPSIVVRPY
ncbi:hypothetical protein [Aureimonas sp. ME7]|uniref:hypothetical protein n=1 Tax=Aureimonas sp. ME7 TaxID=2744252 RepID=UPI0015FE53AE|nr:hypothetical protein [Aureimonas sp. ME7]